MKRIEMSVMSDHEAVVHLAIPVEEPGKAYRVTLQIRPQPCHEWPEGFFERTFGQWEGELERQPQGDYEKRIPFDDP